MACWAATRWDRSRFRQVWHRAFRFAGNQLSELPSTGTGVKWIFPPYPFARPRPCPGSLPSDSVQRGLHIDRPHIPAHSHCPAALPNTRLETFARYGASFRLNLCHLLKFVFCLANIAIPTVAIIWIVM